MKSLLVRHRFVALGVIGLLLVALAVWAQVGRGQPLQGSLGPTPGPNSAGYVREKSHYVLALAERESSRPAAALVSLARLLRPADVSGLAPTARVDVVFVQLPARNPEALLVTETVEQTVGARAAEVAAEAEKQAEALEAEVTAAGDEEGLRQASQLRDQAARLRRDCFCVYAFTVGGLTGAELGRLQQDQDVTLVDVPRPPVTSLRGWELTPILPGGRS